MGFKRILLPDEFVTGETLTLALISIGINLAGDPPKLDANIEDTLIAASIEGMERDDLRVLSLLVTWIEIHHSWINADRVTILAKKQSTRVKAFWCAIATFLQNDQRFKRLQKVYTEKKIDLLRVGNEFQMKRKGEDERFKNSVLKVPAGTLRNRKFDVLSPQELALKHQAYRYRILIGPSYRADMWALLETNPNLSPAELARLTYGSFATAWNVKHSFELLHVEVA